MAQGLVGLGGAAGAGQALERLLARRFQEQQAAEQQQLQQARLAEEQRQAQALEQFRGRELQEQTALRQTQQQALEQERLRDEAFRQQQLQQQKGISEAGLAQARSIQDMLESGRNERATDLAALRRDLDASGASGRPPRFQFLQTPEGYVLGDPYTGTTQPVQAPEGGRLMPRPSANERDTGQSFDDLKNIINTIRSTYSPDFIGPYDYRKKSLGQTLGAADPKFAAFKQAVTALQNATTRLSFSSRASDQDVARAIAEGANPATQDFKAQIDGIWQRLLEREQAFRAMTGVQ